LNSQREKKVKRGLSQSKGNTKEAIGGEQIGNHWSAQVLSGVKKRELVKESALRPK